MQPLTKHHIVPRSRNGTWYAGNIKIIRENIHVALHALFYNRTPPEQIKRIMEIADTALTTEFKNDVAKILKESDNSYYYNKWVLIPKK